MDFKDKLQLLRAEHRLSQEELASKLNIARQSVAKWEKGRSFPDIQNLIMLSEIFKVSIDRLVKNRDGCTVPLVKGQTYSKEDIRLFLVRAKKNCYIANENIAASSRHNSRDYQYAENDYLYADSFWGTEKFGGEEIITIKNHPVYLMNYYGHVLDEDFMKRFTKHMEEWGSFIDIKLCDKEINLNKIKGKNVFLSSVTDCYNPYEEKYQITRNILNQLKNAECSVTVSTKSNLILRDIDILKQFKDLKIALSINTLDENFRRDMDCASSITERLTALKVLSEHGFHTVVFMSPIFPYITDFQSIIENTSMYTSEYWFENLNLRGEYKKSILTYIKNKYPQLLSEYIEIYEQRNMDYWIHLSEDIDRFCQNKNLTYTNYFYHDLLVAQKKKKH